MYNNLITLLIPQIRAARADRDTLTLTSNDGYTIRLKGSTAAIKYYSGSRRQIFNAGWRDCTRLTLGDAQRLLRRLKHMAGDLEIITIDKLRDETEAAHVRLIRNAYSVRHYKTKRNETASTAS